MSAAQSLHLAAEFQVAADPLVVEDEKAVDDGEGLANSFEHPVRIHVKVRSVPHGKNYHFHSNHCRPHVLLDSKAFEIGLPGKESSACLLGKILLRVELRPIR